jgi:putative N-acetyltransferase (TIGR04045 family)
VTDVLVSRSSSRPEASAHVCRPVRTPGERAEHARIRREVFVAEQGLFEADDADAYDDDPATVHVLGLVDGRPAGTVRLYPLLLQGPSVEPGLWKGDRLAVLPEGRRLRIGAPLVRFAVRTAGERGGARMIALIQARNVPFFRHLGWSALGDATDFRGASHQEMTIALAGACPQFAPAGYAWALGA